MISLPVANHTPLRSFMWAMARSRYLMRKGWPMIIGCSGTPMTRGCLLLSAYSRIELIDHRAQILLAVLNEEICHVGARDEPACPATRFDQCAICISLRPHRSELRDARSPSMMDDLAAELRLRGLEPPYGAVEQELADRSAQTNEAERKRTVRGRAGNRRVHARERQATHR
jgi:hypothetical protein